MPLVALILFFISLNLGAEEAPFTYGNQSCPFTRGLEDPAIKSLIENFKNGKKKIGEECKSIGEDVAWLLNEAGKISNKHEKTKNELLKQGKEALNCFNYPILLAQEFRSLKSQVNSGKAINARYQACFLATKTSETQESCLERIYSESYASFQSKCKDQKFAEVAKETETLIQEISRRTNSVMKSISDCRETGPLLAQTALSAIQIASAIHPGLSSISMNVLLGAKTVKSLLARAIEGRKGDPYKNSGLKCLYLDGLKEHLRCEESIDHPESKPSMDNVTRTAEMLKLGAYLPFDGIEKLENAIASENAGELEKALKTTFLNGPNPLTLEDFLFTYLVPTLEKTPEDKRITKDETLVRQGAALLIHQSLLVYKKYILEKDLHKANDLKGKVKESLIPLQKLSLHSLVSDYYKGSNIPVKKDKELYDNYRHWINSQRAEMEAIAKFKAIREQRKDSQGMVDDSFRAFASELKKETIKDLEGREGTRAKYKLPFADYKALTKLSDNAKRDVFDSHILPHLKECLLLSSLYEMDLKSPIIKREVGGYSFQRLLPDELTSFKNSCRVDIPCLFPESNPDYHKELCTQLATYDQKIAKLKENFVKLTAFCSEVDVSSGIEAHQPPPGKTK